MFQMEVCERRLPPRDALRGQHDPVQVSGDIEDPLDKLSLFESSFQNNNRPKEWRYLKKYLFEIL